MNEDVECMDPLRCHLCMFECFSQNELQSHLRIHTELKPLMCTICKEKFSQKSNLEKHCSFFHGGHGHGQTSHIDSKCGRFHESGVQTGGISGTKKEDAHSTGTVKRGRPRKTESNSDDPKLDNSTEDVICLSHEVSSAKIDNKNFVQSNESGEIYGKNREDINSGTTSRKRGRPHTNENTTIHSKLGNSSDEVICLSDNVTTANVKDSQTNSLQCYICFKQFLWFDDLQVHLSNHTEEKPYVCPICKCGFCECDALKTHSLIHTAKDKQVPVAKKPVQLQSHINLEGKTANNSGKAKEVPEDEETEQLQSDINLEEKIASISESAVFPLNPSEKSTNGVVESSVCKYCKTGFVDPKVLESHSNSHLSEKPWTCNHCHESFHQKASLKLHHRCSHAGEKHCICHICKERFHFTCNLNHHLFIHAGKKPFICSICDKGFTQRRDLRVHTMVHHGEKPFKCHICNDGFSAKHHLEAHRNAMSHNGMTRFKCNICSKEFIHERRLQLHMRSHIAGKLRKLLLQRRGASVDEQSTSTKHQTPKPLEVKNCGEKIPNNSVRALLPSKPNEKQKSLICNYCKTGFTKTSTMELHSKTHTHENPWLCNNCQESFGMQDPLIYHRQISHAGGKDWICSECTKRFKTAGNLNQHLIIHIGNKPFKCNICSKGFSQKETLRRHERVHTEEKPYMCTFCNKRFKSANGFKIHGRTCQPKLVEFHSGENSKSRPGAKLVDLETQVDKASTESSESHHNKSIDPNAHAEFRMVATSEEIQIKTTNPNLFDKSNICIYCNTGFLKLKALKMHVESSHTGENPWICNHCPKKFQNQVKLKSHQRISHTGKKHWICHKCKKRFKYCSELSRHLFYHTGERPFKCNICKKGFKHIASLRVHHSSVHTGEKPYICGFCHQRFKYEEEFKMHVQKCLPKTHESSEVSADININTQKPCRSSSLSSQANTSTANDQDQFDKFDLAEKLSEPELLKQSTDIDTTTCCKLSEENRSQEWTSFLKVFNVKVARKF